MARMLELSRLAPQAQQQALLRQIHALAQAREVAIYLVGGGIRDALTGRNPVDWDFAVSDQVREMGEACAQALNAKLVVLDEERLPTVRLVREEEPSFIDLTQLRAGSLEADLQSRDLTINALAVSLDTLLHQGKAPILDPCGGLADMEHQVVRFTSEASALGDPARLLRAYRFAATLGWSLDATVREVVRRHHARLSQVAVERVRDEWCKLLDARRATPVVRQMDEDGLLAEVLPEIEPMKGVTQNEYHHLDVWGHTLLAVELFEKHPIPPSLADYRKQIRDYLRYRITYDKRRRMLIKLSLLLHDVAKPATRTVTSSGRIRFVGHEKEGAEIAKHVCERLRLGGKVKAFVSRLVYNHLRLMYFAKLGTPSPRAVRRFIRHTGEDWLGVILLSYADLNASQGPARAPHDEQVSLRIMRLIADTYYQELESVVHQPRLITGHDLLAMVNAPPGRWVGETLKRIEDMQFNGELKTREEALVAAREYLSRLGLLP